MLNIRDEELFNKVLELEPKLGHTGYGPTYYQLLGVNLDCNKEELEKNYQDLKRLMNDHSELFSKEETEELEEAYKRFISFLGSVWYEKDVGSKGMYNTTILYENNKKFQSMFEELRKNTGTKVTVKYLERNNDNFEEMKLEGKLNSSVCYDSIFIDELKDGSLEGTRYKIDFLSSQSSIIEIIYSVGKTIYVNPYFKDSTKYRDDYINAFRVVCYNFYMAKKIDVIENAETKKGMTYTKKNIVK